MCTLQTRFACSSLLPPRLESERARRHRDPNGVSTNLTVYAAEKGEGEGKGHGDIAYIAGCLRCPDRNSERVKTMHGYFRV